MKHDRLTVSVCFTANKPLTQKQWQKIQTLFGKSVKKAILKSKDVTEKIGHVHIGSPWDNGTEIFP